jgi:hypothetical protein
MPETHYTIQFKSNNSTWTHKDDYCREVKFNDIHEAETVINIIFKDKDVTEASIIKWENNVVLHKENHSEAYTQAEIKIFDALYNLETPALRRKVLQKFLSHFEKCDPKY